MKVHVFKAAVLAAVSFTLAPHASAGYNVTVDDFVLNKNGTTVFSDTYSDGLPPPSHPIAPSTFFRVEGTVSESGGRLIMDQSGGIIGYNASSQPRVYQSVQLNSNASTTQDTSSPDYALGLKSWHNFYASATFDYSVPSPGLVYGLRLADFAQGSTTSGNDTAFLIIYGGGSPQISFYQQNYVLGTVNLLDSTNLLSTPFDQVQLVLSHAANSNQVSASWTYLLGGVAQGIGSFSSTATLFSDEPFTRASLMVSAPIPEPESWALMLAGLGMIGAIARRRGSLPIA